MNKLLIVLSCVLFLNGCEKIEKVNAVNSPFFLSEQLSTMAQQIQELKDQNRQLALLINSQQTEDCDDVVYYEEEEEEEEEDCDPVPPPPKKKPNAKSSTPKASVTPALAASVSSLVIDESPTIIVIKADWCPHCRKLMPIISKIEKEQKITVVILDSEKDKTLIASVMKTRGYPEIQYFNNQKFIGVTSGFVDYNQIVNKF
jgi:thiol-disulfide isomerase/thioredoxin